MKGCWEVLGIPPTTDRQAIKNAYRDLAKRYHPDTVGSPEKKRRHTIRLAEINRARSQAVEYCEKSAVGKQGGPVAAPAEYPPMREAPSQPSAPSSGNRSRASRHLWDYPIGLACLGACVGLLYGLFRFSIWFPNWLSSLPFSSLAREAVSGVLVVPLGVLFGGLISLFTAAPALYFVGLVEDTPLSKYSYKAAWLFVIAANLLIVYCVRDFHWPFEHRHNAYYAFLYELCRFTAAAYVPLVGLGEWAKEYVMYLKVKPSVDSELAILEAD